MATLLLPPAAGPQALGAQAMSPGAAQRSACTPARTALVLSGGAAKGFAHIGVLQVLDSIGVKPDLIVGTSVGALVGSLYASGYTAREVDSLMRALPIASVIRRYEPVVSSSLGLLKPLAVWERGQTGYRLQTGTAREGEVNALMASLTFRGNILARGNFDSLAIPFRAVATDLATQQPIVIGNGDLAFAVRASIALPLVFQPVRRDGTWLIDGAMSANTPVAAARALGAERVWISTLPSAQPDANAFDDPLTLSAALVNTLFKSEFSAPQPDDIEIVSPTHAFENLNFARSASDSLILLGHETARAAFAAARCVRPLTTAGNNGASALAAAAARPAPALPVTIGTVAWPGGAPDYTALFGEIGIVEGQALDMRRTPAAMASLGTSERIRAIWLNPGGAGPTVSFRPEVDPAPARAFGMGVAFDQFMSGRIWIGGVDRSAFAENAEAAFVGRLGSYAQDVTGFVRSHSQMRGMRLPVTAGVRLAHESVRLFSGSGELSHAETQEGGLFFGLRRDPAAAAWRYEAMLDARLWREPGRDTRGSTGIRASLYRARSDYEMGSVIELMALTDFQRVRVDASRDFAAGTVRARLRVRAGWGNRLPVQHEFTLGGLDGFAGLRLGEIRGNQEAFMSLRLQRHVAPQLQLTAEGMAGAMGSGYGILQRRDSTEYGRVFGGIRVGVEAATPIGPIRMEQGFSHTGRRALLVRVGYWF